MQVLKKAQILRLVEALSKLTVKKLDTALRNHYGAQNTSGLHPDTPVKFLGFTNESFETGITAIYEDDREHHIYVSWNGQFTASWLRPIKKKLR
jgi:hypothetical protein